MLSFNSNGLWVFFTILPFDSDISFGSSVYRVFQRENSRDIEGQNMGGQRKRVEPASCKEWMKKMKVWDIIRRRNFIGYMERLKGNNPAITQQFIKSWRDGSIMVGN